MLIFSISASAGIKVVSVSGVIVDDESGDPLNNVIVYAQWVASGGGGDFNPSWRKCKKVELKVTGKAGKFSFSDILSSTGSIGRAKILIYKPGYEIKEIYSDDVNKIRLRKSNRKNRTRINKLNKLLDGAYCFRSNSALFYSRRSEAFLFVKSLFDEVHRYVYTENDLKKIIGSYCNRMAKIEIGEELVKNVGWSGSEDKRGNQIREFIKKNYQRCGMDYLQNIRKSNLVSLVYEKNTEYINRANISGCIVNEQSIKGNMRLIVNGNGVFYIKNKNYLVDAVESVFVHLKKFNVTVLGSRNSIRGVYGMTYGRHQKPSHKIRVTAFHSVRDKVVSVKRNKIGYPQSVEIQQTGMTRMIVKSQDKYIDFKAYLDKEKYYSSYKRLMAKKIEVLKRMKGTLQCGS